MFKNLISTTELSKHLDDPNWLVVDCRFFLADVSQGRRDYQTAHIPGALYAHLDEDLSGQVVPGKTGKHPLPTVEAAAQTFSHFGIDADVQVIAYDSAGGALAAARLWWMLRWLGHEAVAVLDGGWQFWEKLGLPIQAGEQRRPERLFSPKVRPGLTVSVEEVEVLRFDPLYCLFDSRSAERYHGQNETVYPVAGHIPGALSAPYALNLTPEGVFCPQNELRTRFSALLGGAAADQAIFYCGSGVTAAHNILALEYAGLGTAKLYVGSWGEWINDPRRPIAT